MKPLLSGAVLVRMLLLGILMSIASITSLVAYRDGNVNLVAALQQTGIIVTTLLGIVFLHEYQRLWHKAVAAVVCFVAVLFIV